MNKINEESRIYEVKMETVVAHTQRSSHKSHKISFYLVCVTIMSTRFVIYDRDEIISFPLSALMCVSTPLKINIPFESHIIIYLFVYQFLNRCKQTAMLIA